MFLLNEEELRNELTKLIPDLKDIDKLIFFNIGTSKLDMDSFGPIFGSILKKRLKRETFKLADKITILGTIDDNCNVITLEDKFIQYDELCNKYNKIYCIATDAAMCKCSTNFGKFKIDSVPIKPASGVGKTFREIGNLSIRLCTIYNPESIYDTEILDTLPSFIYPEIVFFTNMIVNIIIDILKTKI